MHIRHVVPFLLLFAWQAVPGSDLRDRPSRFKIWFGGGSSSFDLYEATDCDGDRYMVRETWSGGGVRADAWPSPHVRLSAAFSRTEDRSRLLGLAAWEARFAGVGAGWSDAPGRLGYQGLSAYLRLGPVDDAHFRAELRAPTPLPGITGWARAGLAGNMGQRRGGSFFVGLAAVKACPDVPCPTTTPGDTAETVDKLAAFVDAEFALGRWLGVFAKFHVAPNARGFGFGASLRL